MAEWKNGKAVVYEDRHGNTRCGSCCEPLFCNKCGDMPETCPNCGAPLDYSSYDCATKMGFTYPGLVVGSEREKKLKRYLEENELPSLLNAGEEIIIVDPEGEQA